MPSAFATIPIPVPENWISLPYHPLSQLTTFGTQIDMRLMEQFVSINGYDEHEAIVLLKDEEGKLWIFDGRHRHVHCVKTGLTPTFRLYVGSNPKVYVTKKLFRQHLTVAQRSAMADMLTAKPKPPEKVIQGSASRDAPVGTPVPGTGTGHPTSASRDARTEQPNAASPQDGSATGDAPNYSRKEAASIAGVSRESVLRAGKIKATGIPAVAWLVDRGLLGLQEGARIAELPAEEQKAQLPRFFCERCIRTGNLVECARCIEHRAGGHKSAVPFIPPKTLDDNGEPVGRGNTKYDQRAFTSFLGKALTEANKLAREQGHVNQNGTIRDCADLTAIRDTITEALRLMGLWKEKIAVAKRATETA